MGLDILHIVFLQYLICSQKLISNQTASHLKNEKGLSKQSKTASFLAMCHTGFFIACIMLYVTLHTATVKKVAVRIKNFCCNYRLLLLLLLLYSIVLSA